MNFTLNDEESKLLSSCLSIVAAYVDGNITGNKLEEFLKELDKARLQRISAYVTSKYVAEQEGTFSIEAENELSVDVLSSAIVNSVIGKLKPDILC